MNNFNEIRAYYKEALPRMQSEFKETGRMYFDPYALDFMAGLTPIESSVWIDIRSTPIPMYPQLPVLNYFLDFANPFVKVAIECDGKQWHDAAKDVIRDKRLIELGWTIYRITGSKCNRIVPSPADAYQEMRENGCEDQEEIDAAVDAAARKWYMETSQGIVHAIGVKHFGCDTRFENYADLSTHTHMSVAV